MAINNAEMPVDIEESSVGNSGFIPQPESILMDEVPEKKEKEIQVASISPEPQLMLGNTTVGSDTDSNITDTNTTALLFNKEETKPSSPSVQEVQVAGGSMDYTGAEWQQRKVLRKLKTKTNIIQTNQNRQKLTNKIVEISGDFVKNAQEIVDSDENFFGIKKYEFSNLERVLLEVPIKFSKMNYLAKGALRKAISEDGPGVAIGLITAWNFADTYKGQTGDRIEQGLIHSANWIKSWGQNAWEAKENPMFVPYKEKYFNSTVKP